MDPNIPVRGIVSLACDALTNDELVAIALCAQLGTNPKGVMGYDKVSYLFTKDNGTRMHDGTLAALLDVLAQRMKMGNGNRP